MPLCPECICHHTDFHQQEKTRPYYVTIHEAMADVHTLMNSCIESLEEDKKRNVDCLLIEGNLIVKIQIANDKIKEKIENAKKMVYQAVEECFKNLEKDVLKQLHKLHEEKSIFSLEKSEKQDRILIEYLDELNCMKNSLKTEKGLSNIIFFLREKQDEVDSFHSQFSHYLHVPKEIIETNENYSPQVEINNEALYSMDSVISRVIRVGAEPSISLRRKDILYDHSSISPIKNSALAIPSQIKTKEKSQINFVESQVDHHSPYKSRLGISKSRSVIRVDGDHEKLSRKVAMMKEENEKLTKLLRYNEHKIMRENS